MTGQSANDQFHASSFMQGHRAACLTMSILCTALLSGCVARTAVKTTGTVARTAVKTTGTVVCEGIDLAVRDPRCKQ